MSKNRKSKTMKSHACSDKTVNGWGFLCSSYLWNMSLFDSYIRGLTGISMISSNRYFIYLSISFHLYPYDIWYWFLLNFYIELKMDLWSKKKRKVAENKEERANLMKVQSFLHMSDDWGWRSMKVNGLIRRMKNIAIRSMEKNCGARNIHRSMIRRMGYQAIH